MFFNPASFFRFPMAGLQYISQARTAEEKKSAKVDFVSWVNWLYPASGQNEVN